jgi:hypothetical protein
VIARIANSRRGTRAGIALLAMLCLAGFVALAWPTAAQEIRYRPRGLLERLFTRDVPDQPRAVPPRAVRPRAVQPRATAKSDRNLFERLFSTDDEEEQQPIKKAVRSKARVKSGTASSQVVRVQEPEALPKAETARPVLVVGDFMASGLSEGLVSAYSQNPAITIVERTNGSSGIVRSDFHDWPTELKALIDQEKPAAVVIMLGANDRQQMKIGDTREQPMSDNWLKEYQARTDAVAAAVKERHLPFVWVGLPAFKSAKVSSDLLTLNDIYRKSAESAGGSFVDIWDGFVDENGAFVMNGPDMNGQPVRLRGPDGVTLSTPGKRKVAFYVEKPLNKLLGTEAAPAPGLESVGPVAPTNIYVDRTQPMAIDDPELDGGQVLLGETSQPKKETRTVAEKLVVEGVAAAPAPGRADDFGGAAPPVAAVSAPAAVAAGATAPPGQPEAGSPAEGRDATAADTTSVINR